MPEPAELSLEEVEAAGRRLWAELPAGAVLWLSGDLGAGKTTLARAVTQAAGASPARSPTFALVHEYGSADGPILHVDCYRLRSPEEAADLDFPGLEARARLLIIEWPERAGSWAPPPGLHLRLTHGHDRARRRLEAVS